MRCAAGISACLRRPRRRAAGLQQARQAAGELGAGLLAVLGPRAAAAAAPAASACTARGHTPVGPPRPRCPGARAAPPVLAPGLGLGCMPVMGGRGPVCVAPAGPLKRPLARRGGCCLRPACAAGASEGACVASGARASRRTCGTSPGASKHTACTMWAGGQAGGAPHAGVLA